MQLIKQLLEYFLLKKCTTVWLPFYSLPVISTLGAKGDYFGQSYSYI